MEQKKFDEKKFHNAVSQSNTKGKVQNGVLSIVNSPKNGKRLAISQSVMEQLGNPQKIQFSMSADTLAISESLPDNEKYFNLRLSGKKYLVYSTSLVVEITKNFSLDFKSQVCRTFSEVEYLENESYQIALIKIK